MTRTSRLILASLLAGLAVGCHSTRDGLPAVTGDHTIAPRGTVAVRWQQASFATQVLERSIGDIAKVRFTLYDNANVAVTGITNPVDVTVPATTATFAAVPDGTGYYVKADALTAADVSLTFGGAPVQSGNTVSFTGGIPTYSSGTALSVSITLESGNPGSTQSGTSTLTFFDGGGFGDPDHFGWALINNASRRVAALPLKASVGTTATANISNEQPGSKVAGVATHEVWGYVVHAATGKATPAQRIASPANVTGQMAGATLHGDIRSMVINSPGPALVPAVSPMLTDEWGNIYYVDAAHDVIKRTPGVAPTTLFNTGAATTGIAASRTGDIIYSTGTAIKRRVPLPSMYATDTTLVTAANVGRIAVDELGNLYWLDTATNQIMVATAFHGTYGTPATAVSAAQAGTPTMLAVDAWGDIFYSGGTDIKRATRDRFGVWEATPTTVVTSAGVQTFAVDRVGHVYLVQAADDNYIKMVPRNGDAATLYKVVGNGVTPGNGLAALTGSLLSTDDFVQPRNIAISADGTILCTSKGPAFTGDYLRKITPL